MTPIRIKPAILKAVEASYRCASFAATAKDAYDSCTISVKAAACSSLNFCGQSGLPKNRVSRRLGFDREGKTEIFLADRASPNFVTAFALPNEFTTRRAQHLFQLRIKR